MSRLLFGLVTACAVLAGLAATGASGSTTAARATPAFPVTVTAGNGKVTVSRAPRRIVSLSATATESLFAIGAGSQVVAVDEQSDYPKGAPKTTLSGFTPNVEAIVAYRPDLVIASYDPKGLVDALGRLGITVLVHNAAMTLPGAYKRWLGTTSNKSPRRNRSLASATIRAYDPGSGCGGTSAAGVTGGVGSVRRGRPRVVAPAGPRNSSGSVKS